MSDDIISLIKSVPLFSKLDEPSLKRVTSVASMRTYPKNSVIFNEGEEGNILFILKSGVVKIVVTNKEGKQIILKVLKNNDYFGEMSLLDGGYRSATIVAVEDCKAVLIFRKDLISIFKRHPSVVLSMLASLSSRLRNANEKIADLTFLNASGKVAQMLSNLVQSSGKEDENGRIILDLSFSRQELAEMSGLSRETLIRVLNKFQEKVYIKIEKKRIIVIDIEGLNSEI